MVYDKNMDILKFTPFLTVEKRNVLTNILAREKPTTIYIFLIFFVFLMWKLKGLKGYLESFMIRHAFSLYSAGIIEKQKI